MLRIDEEQPSGARPSRKFTLRAEPIGALDAFDMRPINNHLKMREQSRRDRWLIFDSNWIAPKVARRSTEAGEGTEEGRWGRRIWQCIQRQRERAGMPCQSRNELWIFDHTRLNDEIDCPFSCWWARARLMTNPIESITGQNYGLKGITLLIMYRASRFCPLGNSCSNRVRITVNGVCSPAVQTTASEPATEGFTQYTRFPPQHIDQSFRCCLQQQYSQ